MIPKLFKLLDRLLFGKDLIPPPDIVETVSKHVDLKSGGELRHYVGTCPFCESEGALSVSERRQVFHCFDCRKGGDSIQFKALILGKTYRELLLEYLDSKKDEREKT